MILHLIHKALWWLVLAPVAVVLKLFSFTLGWLFIAPFVKADGNLPYPLRYLFQPDDSLAIGDDPKVASTVFQDREGAWTKTLPSYLRNYVLCVMWACMRNPAYGFDSTVCGVRADIKILHNWGIDIDWGYDSNENAVYSLGWQIIVAEQGYWALRFAFVIPFTTRGFLCQFGWNLRGGVVNSSIRNLKIDIAGKSTRKNKV